MPAEGLRSDLARRKAVKLLADSAVIVAPKADEAPAEEAKTEE